MVVQSARHDHTNNFAVPTIIYDGALNTRLDGDVFTARIAVRAHEQINNWDEVDLNIEIGFPAQTATITQDGLLGTAEIDYTISQPSLIVLCCRGCLCGDISMFKSTSSQLIYLLMHTLLLFLPCVSVQPCIECAVVLSWKQQVVGVVVPRELNNQEWIS